MSKEIMKYLPAIITLLISFVLALLSAKYSPGAYGTVYGVFSALLGIIAVAALFVALAKD